MKKALFLLVSASIILGCQGENSAQPEGSSSSSANQSVSTPESSEPVASAPDMSAVPDSLKHDGYQYFGLEYNQPLSYVQTAGGAGQDAGQTTTFEKMENGKAYFNTVRTGQFSQIGNSQFMVDETGIYAISVGGTPLKKPSLEVPAKLAPGSKWHADSTFSINNSGTQIEVRQNMDYVAKTIETVKTKAGNFEALKITAKGTMVISGNESKTESSMWFSKGIGFVKMDQSITSNGKKQMVNVELVEK